MVRWCAKNGADIVLFSELMEQEQGMKWIKSKEVYGVLVHGKRSGVLLLGAWATRWREEGNIRKCGNRCTMVEVGEMRMIAVYQPLWNEDKLEFGAYREETNEAILGCGRNKKLIVGGF